jgi:hypothetical protein
MSGFFPPRRAGPLPGLAELVAKKHRKRTFAWCRRPNGFSDNPKWRVVARNAKVGLAVVIAFVNRLEELGNDAANRSDLRGSIAEFDADTFAAALDVSMEQVQAIYASLEHVGWIADSVIADFEDRNPDQEDPTAAERQRKKRSRTKIQKRLDELTMNGKFSRADRIEFQARMQGLDHDGLIRLQMDMEEVANPVTRDSRLSQRDVVTITPDKKDHRNGSKVEVLTSASASGEVVGSAKEEEVSGKTDQDVERWLRDEAADFLTQRWGIPLDSCQTRLRGWWGR